MLLGLAEPLDGLSVDEANGGPAVAAPQRLAIGLERPSHVVGISRLSVPTAAHEEHGR
jgi:hypothetical protein